MDINKAIAQNVRRAREQKKLTLDAAAGLTTVSRSMLAQIEKGDVNPTISVLWKIANGYKVSFHSLVETVEKESAFLPCAVPMREQEDGKYLNYPTFPFHDEKLFEMYRIVIEVDGYLAAEPHLVGSEEYLTVFDGRVAVTVAEKEYTLERGDSLRFAADQKHSYRNVGDRQASLSMLISYAK